MSKIVIKTGKVSTQTNYEGEVSPIDLLNAVKALIEDVHKMDGSITYKIALALVADALGVKTTHPPMRASVSEATARE